MKISQQARIESWLADPQLADKPIYGDQTLADRIDCEEKTFKSYGAEQRRTIGRNEAWSRDFIAVQSQPCFGHGPYVSLSAGDYDALRACGLELKPFRQRSGQHAKSSAGVHKKLYVFDTSRRTGQASLYVKQSHLKYLLENTVIVAQPTNNATTSVGQVSGARAVSLMKSATRTIPIVMTTIENPVAMGIVDTLASPGENITGLTNLAPELSGQRLGLNRF